MGSLTSARHVTTGLPRHAPGAVGGRKLRQGGSWLQLHDSTYCPETSRQRSRRADRSFCLPNPCEPSFCDRWKPSFDQQEHLPTSGELPASPSSWATSHDHRHQRIRQRPLGVLRAGGKHVSPRMCSSTSMGCSPLTAPAVLLAVSSRPRMSHPCRPSSRLSARGPCTLLLGWRLLLADDRLAVQRPVAAFAGIVVQ